MSWQSNTENDVDSDGCNDLLEDSSLPSKLLTRNILVVISIAIIAIFCLTIYISPKNEFSNVKNKRNKSKLSNKNVIDDFDLDILIDMANGLDQNSSNGKSSIESLTSTITKVITPEIKSNKEELPKPPLPSVLSGKTIFEEINHQMVDKTPLAKPIEPPSEEQLAIMKNNIEKLQLSDLISSAVNLNDPIEWLQMAEKLSDSGNLEDAIICKRQGFTNFTKSD